MSLVLTLGPACEKPQFITALYQKAERFRLNTSHLTLIELEAWLNRLWHFFQKKGAPLPVILDLQGAKMRIGKFPTGALYTSTVTLFLGQESNNPQHIPVPYVAFFEAIKPEDIISLNDAKVKLEITQVIKDRAEANVLISGPLDSFKGINRAIQPLPFTQTSEKDAQIIAMGLEYPFTQFACSFILDGTEATRLRPLIADRLLIAKIERPEAMSHLAIIESHFDEIWFCRGDMGSHTGFSQLGKVQETFVRYTCRSKKTKFLAGQVLEHMTHFPEPTRSEVVHLYDAIKAGFDGIVLSDETAIGAYPIQASETAKQLIKAFKNQTLNTLGN